MCGHLLNDLSRIDAICKKGGQWWHELGSEKSQGYRLAYSAPFSVISGRAGDALVVARSVGSITCQPSWGA
jgi:hypothetical protein